MRIDAHQHFWRYTPEEYGWIDDSMQTLRRDFLPETLAPDLGAGGFDGSIAVQARSSEDETRFLLELAEANPSVLGVVGWVDLRGPNVVERLRELAHPKLLGLRHVVQDEPEEDFLLRSDFQRGVTRLSGTRLDGTPLVYDLLVYARQMRHATPFAAAVPNVPLVLDHLGKPEIAAGHLDPWRAELTALAQHPHVSCKLSGLVTEAQRGSWTPADMHPYLDHALEAFGPRRVMFGSDWPVCLLAAEGHQAVTAIVEDWAARLSAPEQRQLFGENAARIYGVPAA